SIGASRHAERPEQHALHHRHDRLAGGALHRELKEVEAVRGILEALTGSEYEPGRAAFSRLWLDAGSVREHLPDGDLPQSRLVRIEVRGQGIDGGAVPAHICLLVPV